MRGLPFSFERNWFSRDVERPPRLKRALLRVLDVWNAWCGGAGNGGRGCACSRVGIAVMSRLRGL